MNGDSTPHVAGGSPEDLATDVRARLADAAGNRSDAYRSLAVGLSEPDESLYAALADGSFAAGLARAVSWLGEDARLYRAGLHTLAEVRAGTPGGATPAGGDRAGASSNPNSDTPTVPDLAAEFARLFTGPGRVAVPRFASQYLDEPGPDGRGPLNGPTTQAVTATYEAEGLAPRTSLREPGDDIATELEFLAWLASQEAGQWTDGSVEAALRLRRAADRFLREHCEAWWPAFAEAVIEHSRLAAYTGMARLLVAHLAAELGISAGSLAPVPTALTQAAAPEQAPAPAGTEPTPPTAAGRPPAAYPPT